MQKRLCKLPQAGGLFKRRGEVYLIFCVLHEVPVFSSPTIQPHYILKYSYVEDILTKRAPHRAAHISLAQEFKRDGRIIMGGALADLTGATVIFRSKEDIENFIKQDPYFNNGLVTNHETAEWSVVV